MAVLGAGDEHAITSSQQVSKRLHLSHALLREVGNEVRESPESLVQRDVRWGDVSRTPQEVEVRRLFRKTSADGHEIHALVHGGIEAPRQWVLATSIGRRYVRVVTTRWIVHADMDAFYASVEQRERPELRGKPVIVGANSARGVVSAASYEAREYGVHSAMPGFRAKELCPHGVFLPGRMALYSEVSAQVREVFENFTPQIQPLALDEAFLDVSGTMHFHDGPRALGEALKAQVKRRTQLNVSVGIASNKLVAKVACTLGKPNGLKVIAHGDESSLLAPLPIRKLWGVGPVTAGKLQAHGIRTIGELADFDLVRLSAIVGQRAAQFQAWARGRDDSTVQSDQVPKSCGEENTFAVDVIDRNEVSAALTAHAETVAARLRAASLRGRTVTLKIKLGSHSGRRAPRVAGEPGEPRYPLLSRSRSLDVATSDGKAIRDVALELWDQASVGVPVRLLGVSVSNLEPDAAPRQLDLFGQRQKADRLGPTLDEIRQRFGKAAIRRAVDEPEKTTIGLHRKS